MILISFGTRPEWIKIKPLVEYLEGKSKFKLLFTGQHRDIIDSIDYKMSELSILNGNNRLDSIVCSVLNKDSIFQEIDSVLIQGDTTSAFSVALAAFHRKIKIIHLEAGLRTWDKDHPYPEEFNRKSIAAMADIHLCPTELCKQNLLAEKVGGIVEVVGNTVLDNLLEINTQYKNQVIITMHRRENHHIMDLWFHEIQKLAEQNPDLKFILPIHPNPNVQKHKNILKNVDIVPPLVYNDFIKLISESKLIITDSGGIQEEASFLGKKCIVCREKTEREEAIPVFSNLCKDPAELSKLFYKTIGDYIPYGECPFGDGNSSEKIFRLLKKEGIC